MFAGLFLGAEWIAGKMGDPDLTSLLKMVSYYYLLMPFISIFRGYFQGINQYGSYSCFTSYRAIHPSNDNISADPILDLSRVFFV